MKLIENTKHKKIKTINKSKTIYKVVESYGHNYETPLDNDFYFFDKKDAIKLQNNLENTYNSYKNDELFLEIKKLKDKTENIKNIEEVRKIFLTIEKLYKSLNKKYKKNIEKYEFDYYGVLLDKIKVN